MPNTSAAKKALRQNVVRNARNRSQRSTLRTILKKCRAAAGTADADAAFRIAVKSLDKAAAKNLIHANTAARTKSRLSKLLKNAKATAAGGGE